MRFTSRLGIAATATALLFAQPAAAAEKIKLAISHKGIWDTSIATMGQYEGMFKKEGFDVELLYTNGTSETLQAVLSGSVDIGVGLGLLGVFGAYSKGAPVRIIASEWTGASDMYWYVKSDSPIKTFADVSGKTVAFSRPGSSTNLVALALLDAYKVSADLTPTGSASGTLTQVMSGQIDVGWGLAPIALTEVRDGKLRIVARGNDSTSLKNQTTRVIVSRAEVLETRRDTVKRFMEVYSKVLDWAYENPKALEYFAQGLNKPLWLATKARDDHYPKSAMKLAPISGLDNSMSQAVKYKRLEEPLSQAQLDELIDVVYSPSE